MKKLIRHIKNFIFLSMLIFGVSCKKGKTIVSEDSLPFFNSALFTPEWIKEDDPKYQSIHTIPDFELTNQDGKKVTNKNYEGKIYVADFFFVSCPGICPILEKNMSRLQDEFKTDKEVLMLSHTVMPVKDSVPALKEYASKNNIDSKKWNLVTGDKKQIYNLARKGYFADEDFVKTKDEEAFIHTENFVLVDKKRRIRGVYNGTLAIDIERLIRHIKMLKLEK
ncbi:protein SCO1 [Tenacibaculum sp. 190524A02b]|uniref:Protein SCO1 n=1 Tax=Tenacibaculum vairaonense TaxID=3137860 RepID=A0ABP1FHB9_9FLAO